jgi:hypothetical protein
MFPEFGQSWREKAFGNLNRLADKCFRLGTECELDTFRGPEEIGDDRIVASLHACKQQRGSTARDHATVYLGYLKVRINLDINKHEIVFAFEQVKE